MSLNRAMFKYLEREVKQFVDMGIIYDQEEATDWFCSRRKRIMRKQRASRKARRGWT